MLDSRLRTVCDQPSRLFGVAAKCRGSPIINSIFIGRGIFRFGGRASKLPTRPQGTTGTFVSATSIPRPCLKGTIEPVRVRPPSGKMIKIALSSCKEPVRPWDVLFSLYLLSRRLAQCALRVPPPQLPLCLQESPQPLTEGLRRGSRREYVLRHE